MQLLIDIGNTAIKWATGSNDQLQPMSRFNYSFVNLSLQLEQRINSQLAIKPLVVVVANVAGKEIESVISRWCEKSFQLRPHFAKVEKQTHGLVNAYSNPEKLGVDRWLALVAASDCYQMPFCVIDCGTAVTIDGVNKKGQFIGGAILPGLSLMRQSLLKSTEAIKTVENAKIQNVFAKDTEQGVLAGTIYAISTLIEHMTKKLQAQSNQEITCILTGGDANTIRPYLSLRVEHVPELVLQGLYLWGKENALD